MAFTTWAAELARFKDALANQSTDTLLKLGWTRADGQSHTFRKYKDIMDYLKFLEDEALKESQGGKRSRPFSFGYSGRG